MIFDLFTQGYGFTAVLLFILYCFHTKYRAYYFTLAKVANRLIWAFSLGSSLLMLYAMVATYTTVDSFEDAWITPAIFLVPFIPYFLITVCLLFRKIRKRSIWLLLPIALILNIGITFDLYGNAGGYLFPALYDLPDGVRFTVFGLAFLILLIAVQLLSAQAKRNIKNEESKLPERI